MKLGERIERRRKEIGISQAELARRVGIRQSTLNSLIKGNSRTSRSLIKIAWELKTTPAFLMGETEDSSIDAACLSLSPQDRGWLDLLHDLTPRDRAAVLQLARTLAGTQRYICDEPDIPVLQERQIEYRGSE